VCAALFTYAALTTLVGVDVIKTLFSSNVIGAAFFAVGGDTKLLRRRDALLFECEYLTGVGRIKLPNSQTIPLPS
jgi:hypothetical protein